MVDNLPQGEDNLQQEGSLVQEDSHQVRGDIHQVLGGTLQWEGNQVQEGIHQTEDILALEDIPDKAKRKHNIAIMEKIINLHTKICICILYVIHNVQNKITTDIH